MPRWLAAQIDQGEKLDDFAIKRAAASANKGVVKLSSLGASWEIAGIGPRAALALAGGRGYRRHSAGATTTMAVHPARPSRR
jgi:hypothetical protein